jgi:NTE family protein
MKQKFALIVSGGGFKGAFQLGALQYLRDHWHLIDPSGYPMRFDIVAGISVGALNGVMVAMDKLDELEELWLQVGQNGVEEIYTSEFINTEAKGDDLQLQINFKALVQRLTEGFEYKPSIWDGLSLIFSGKAARKGILDRLKEGAVEALKDRAKTFKGLADNSPLKQKLEHYVDRREIKDCEYLCGLVDLDHGLYRCLSHRDYASNEDFVNGILASTAIPIVWDPVPVIRLKDGEPLFNSVDGGIRNSSPISDVLKAIERDPEREESEYTLVIVNCNNGLIQHESFNEANILKIAARSLTEITLSEIFNNDLALFFRVNELAEQAAAVGQQLFKTSAADGEPAKKPLRYFRSVLIQPEGHTLGNMLVANEALINRRIEHGAAQAEAALERFLVDEGGVTA